MTSTKTFFAPQVADLVRGGMDLHKAIKQVMGGIKDGSGDKLSDIMDDLMAMGVWSPKPTRRY